MTAVLLLVGTAAAPAASGGGASPVAQDTQFTSGDGSVFVHIPVNANGIGVVVLHSLGHTAAEPVSQGWSAASDRHGFIALYPERGTSWNSGLCCGSAAAQQRDDVSWLAQVIATARSTYHLKTIYLAGFSNGGMMVERLIAERPELSDRFAVWGAAPEMPDAGSWSGSGYLFEGAQDGLVPRAGGMVTFDGSTTYIRPAAITGEWIAGAHLRTALIPGFGHPPPSTWPEMAWSALSEGVTP